MAGHFLNPCLQREKNEIAHPVPNPVLGIATKQSRNRRKGQDAIEDYSESCPEVQVLCL